jgi:hypothetical protein
MRGSDNIDGNAREVGKPIVAAERGEDSLNARWFEPIALKIELAGLLNHIREDDEGLSFLGKRKHDPFGQLQRAEDCSGIRSAGWIVEGCEQLTLKKRNVVLQLLVRQASRTSPE